MKLKKLGLFLCFLIIIFFTACSRKLSLKERVFLLKEPILKGEDIEVGNFLNPHMTKESLGEGSLNLNLAENYHDYRRLTSEKIIEDIDILFERLKTTYGGYIAFGGEDEFEKAKVNILKEVGTKDIDAIDFKSIIIKNLNFINDAHFLIGGERLREFNNTRIALDIEIEKENGRYKLKNSSQSIDIRGFEKFIKPSLDENGNITYKLFYKEFDKDEIPDLNWKSLDNINHGDNIEPEYKEVNDIKILKVKKFYHLANNKEYHDFVIEKAKNLADCEYGILDLRGNMGGNGLLVNELIKAYSGKNGRMSADIIYYVNLEESKTDGAGQTTEAMLDYFKSMGIKKYDKNHYFGRGSDEVFEKEGILFVLIDGGSGSASEHTIDILRHFNNTIFVGVPSKGMMISSSSTATVLPNSKIGFYWGNMYINLEPSYFREFYGFEPDIWVEPEHAEERVLKLIENMRSESDELTR